MILGVTGRIASGKGTFIDFLKEKGFVATSLSAILRGIAAEKGIIIERKSLQDLGNRLREEKGNSVLAQFTIDKIKENGWENVIIDSIRNPAEAEYFKENLKNFKLISFDAPQEIRFQRALERNRESDPKTFDRFKEIDDRDFGIGEQAHGQGVGKCMEMADFHIINNGSLEELQDKVSRLFEDVKKSEGEFVRDSIQPIVNKLIENPKFIVPIKNLLNTFDKYPEVIKPVEKWKRPDWDNYYMGVAFYASMKSLDPSGKHGCVIVSKDFKPISWGYNGPPAGSDDGKILDIIKKDRTRKADFMEHAERNAILHADNNKLKDSIFYITGHPCVECIRQIVQCGASEIVYGPVNSRYVEDNHREAINIIFAGRTKPILRQVKGREYLAALLMAHEYFYKRLDLGKIFEE